MPRFPGVTSALGCVMADMRHDSVQTLNTTLAGLDEADLARRVQALADSCQQRLDSAGVAFEGVRERIELDMLYAGQSHTVNVPVERQALTRAASPQLSRPPIVAPTAAAWTACRCAC